METLVLNGRDSAGIDTRSIERALQQTVPGQGEQEQIEPDNEELVEEDIVEEYDSTDDVQDQYEEHEQNKEEEQEQEEQEEQENLESLPIFARFERARLWAEELKYVDDGLYANAIAQIERGQMLALEIEEVESSVTAALPASVARAILAGTKTFEEEATKILQNLTLVRNTYIASDSARALNCVRHGLSKIFAELPDKTKRILSAQGDINFRVRYEKAEDGQENYVLVVGATTRRRPGRSRDSANEARDSGINGVSKTIFDKVTAKHFGSWAELLKYFGHSANNSSGLKIAASKFPDFLDRFTDADGNNFQEELRERGYAVGNAREPFIVGFQG